MSKSKALEMIEELSKENSGLILIIKANLHHCLYKPWKGQKLTHIIKSGLTK